MIKGGVWKNTEVTISLYDAQQAWVAAALGCSQPAVLDAALLAG